MSKDLLGILCEQSADKEQIANLKGHRVRLNTLLRLCTFPRLNIDGPRHAHMEAS